MATERVEAATEGGQRSARYDEIARRFTYHPPKEDQVARYESLRRIGKEFAEAVGDLTPESREQALALTSIEQAVMWANAAIARRE